MKKHLLTIVSIISVLALTACAGSASEAPADYTAYIPENAVETKTERDDGFIETDYRTDAGEEYSLYTDNTGAVQALKYDSKTRSTAAEAALTEDEAFAVITALYPNAAPLYAAQTRDDGAYEWDILFTDGEILAEYDLDAATGAVLDYAIFYTASAEFDPVSIIASNYPGSEIRDLDLDIDDGRLQVDGTALLENRPYDFAIDAATGKIIEWEYDD